MKVKNGRRPGILTDTTAEIDDLSNRRWMSKTPQERNLFAARMNAAARRVVVASLGAGLSEREFKQRLHRRLYGEKLPDDFFDQHPPKD